MYQLTQGKALRERLTYHVDIHLGDILGEDSDNYRKLFDLSALDHEFSYHFSVV